MTLDILAIVLSLGALGVSLMRFGEGRATHRRRSLAEEARIAVAGVEQANAKGLKGPDKARIATQHLLDMHPKLKPAAARILVEAAVADMQAKR